MVGERIRYYRKRQKMTLRELGEKSGFENRGDVRIAQYENWSRVPRTGTLNRIAKALGIVKEQINIKATTEEGLGFTGTEEGISSQAICMLNGFYESSMVVGGGS